MRNLIVLLSLAGFMLVGCSSTGNQYGYWSGLGPGGGRTARYANPSMPVATGQVAFSGINGPSGPYAAALGVGTIESSETQRLVADTIVKVSENESYGYGRGGRYGMRRMNTAGYPQRGVVVNRSSWTCEVFIDGGSSIVVPAQDWRFLDLMPGQYVFRVVSSKNNGLAQEISSPQEVNEARNDNLVTLPRSHRTFKTDWVFSIG